MGEATTGALFPRPPAGVHSQRREGGGVSWVRGPSQSQPTLTGW